MCNFEINLKLAAALDDLGAFFVAALFREGVLSARSANIDAGEILQGLGLFPQPSLLSQAAALQTVCESTSSIGSYPDG